MKDGQDIGAYGQDAILGEAAFAADTYALEILAEQRATSATIEAGATLVISQSAQA